MAMKKSSGRAVAATKPNTEAHWRAQSDMRTLAEAKTIQSDDSRHNAAKAMAKQEVANLRKVAGRG